MAQLDVADSLGENLLAKRFQFFNIKRMRMHGI